MGAALQHRLSAHHTFIWHGYSWGMEQFRGTEQGRVAIARKMKPELGATGSSYAFVDAVTQALAQPAAPASGQ